MIRNLFAERIWTALELPKPAEVEAFVEDSSPDKRKRMIDALMKRPNLWITGPISGPTVIGFSNRLQTRRCGAITTGFAIALRATSRGISL